MAKLKIGITSEHPLNDGAVVKDLLESYFPEQATYEIILEDYRGSSIGNKRYFKRLQEVFEVQNFDFILLIKDLDSDDNKKESQAIFEKVKTCTNEQAVLLLFRYMIEALAIIDFETTETHYNKKIPHKQRPNNTKNAKKDLAQLFGYSESHIRNLVPNFDKRILYQNYDVWQVFINHFQDILQVKALF